MPEEGQRSEQPTPRRLQQARLEGQVASSRDLTQAVQFALAAGLLSWSAQAFLEGLQLCYRGFFGEAFRDPFRVSARPSTC
jgi:flagellar biosynthesis protein FlhB